MERIPGTDEDWELEPDFKVWRMEMCRKMTQINVCHNSDLIVSTFRCLDQNCGNCKRVRATLKVKHHILCELPLWFATMFEADDYPAIEQKLRKIEVGFFSLGGPVNCLVLTDQQVFPESRPYPLELLSAFIDSVLSTTSWKEGCKFKTRNSEWWYVSPYNPSVEFVRRRGVVESCREALVKLQQHGYELCISIAGVHFLTRRPDQPEETLDDLIRNGVLHNVHWG